MEQVNVNPFLVQRNQMIEAIETTVDMYLSAYDYALKKENDTERADKIATNVVYTLMKAGSGDE